LDGRGRASGESDRAGWFDRAIETCERSLSLRPDHAGTLNNLTGTLLRKWRVVTVAQQKEEILAAAASRIERAMSLDADRARYNYACVLALQGQADRALAELRTVVAQNCEERRQIAEDEDFASLADLPEFRELVGEQGS
jgi:tetratricopeptide (TPR) repeat protein